MAATAGADNLVAILDCNRLGQSQPTALQHDTSAYARRFAAFGWNTVEVDGHDIDALAKVLEGTRSRNGKPTAIIAKTFKGQGVSWMSDKEGFHGKPVPKDKLESTLAELGAVDISLSPARAISVPPNPSSDGLAASFLNLQRTAYKVGDSVATRNAYGTALLRIVQNIPRAVVLDADVKNSTMSLACKGEAPERFVDCGIAEQNMVGVAIGLAGEGFVPFAATFACFLSRAFDFIRMAGLSKSAMVLCGSHTGVSIGEDGPSQMGLEDLSMMRSVFGSTVLCPADAACTEACLALAAAAGGIGYVRTARGATPVLYGPDEKFAVGGSKVLIASESPRATIVAAGVTVYEALDASKELISSGVAVEVVDCYSIKPIDAETLVASASKSHFVVTVEDHSVYGGLGDAVASAVAGCAKITQLGVREVSRSGPPTALRAAAGIDAAAVVAAVRAGL